MLYIGAAEALVLRPQAKIKTRATSGGGVDERAIRRDTRLDRPYPVPMPSAGNRILWPGGDVIQIGDQPARMSLFVTATEPTRLQLAGNSTLAGSIHAPYAQLELSGSGNNGRFKGAAVLGSITINGRYQFHFDEALRFSQQPIHRYTVTGWRKPSRNARDLPTQLSDNLSDSESLHASGL